MSRLTGLPMLPQLSVIPNFASARIVASTIRLLPGFRPTAEMFGSQGARADRD